MRKWIQRKSLIRVIKRNLQDTHFQEDLVSLIREKKRILRTKAALGKYYSRMEEAMMTAVVVKRIQTKGNHGVPNCIKKSLFQWAIIFKSRLKIEKE